MMQPDSPMHPDSVSPDEPCVLVDHVKAWLTQCDDDERMRRIATFTRLLHDVITPWDLTHGSDALLAYLDTEVDVEMRSPDTAH